MNINSAAFIVALMEELVENSANWYGADNWDSDRYGKYQASFKSRLIAALNKILQRKVNVSPRLTFNTQNFSNIQHLIQGFSKLYDLLEDDYSKAVFVKVIAYRLLGHHKVALPLNTKSYWSQRKLEKSLVKSKETIASEYHQWILNHFALNKIGYPIELFTVQSGIQSTFSLRQYQYNKHKNEVSVKPGDYVIDAGGCWGDTALYFAHLIGEQGRVYTFEFVSDNLEVLRHNLALNPHLENRIKIIPYGLWDRSEQQIGYSAYGPSTSLNQEANASTHTETLAIDDFVMQHDLPRVDFIKMDIEGAEFRALKGAKKTIQAFKPDLAIALYHNINDFVVIPDYLDNLGLGYQFFLDHFTTHQEETILFAQSRNS